MRACKNITKNIIIICSMVLVILLCITSIEISFYFLNKHKGENAARKWTIRNDFFQPSTELGYKALPSINAKATYTLNEKIVYDVSYSIDQYGRRKTFQQEKGSQQRFLIFMGCSFTFGEGLEDNQTLPFYTVHYTQDYIAYNYGFLGYGPQQMLEHLLRPDFKNEIGEKAGILIYTFIDDHVCRAIGSMHVYCGWGKNMPYYEIDKTQKLIRIGTFDTNRPFVSALYSLLNNSQFIKYLTLDFPRIRESHIYLTARIINESCTRFKQLFNNSDFCIVIYPGSMYGKRLIPYFKDTEIHCLDYSQLIDSNNSLFFVDEHRHPSEKAFKIIAKHLNDDLAIGVFSKK